MNGALYFFPFIKQNRLASSLWYHLTHMMTHYNSESQINQSIKIQIGIGSAACRIPNEWALQQDKIRQGTISIRRMVAFLSLTTILYHSSYTNAHTPPTQELSRQQIFTLVVGPLSLTVGYIRYSVAWDPSFLYSHGGRGDVLLVIWERRLVLPGAHGGGRVTRSTFLRSMIRNSEIRGCEGVYPRSW